MKNQIESMRVLTQLKELGITISMDDFGTGYSSLSYLKNLPIDRLKIDRSFIMEIPENKDDVAIVKTIISLTKNLGIDIIAEGVETWEQVDFLVKEGCYNIQGYYYSKPLTLEQLKQYIQKDGIC
jgi:EAL domain-containing protein (putative c-di-GMP-specific phosphodiesterase class I)